MIDYSEAILKAFDKPRHVYNQSSVDLIGHAGEISIGEYVNLYFKVDKADVYANTKIMRATFSVIGGVVTIAAAETFCSLIEGHTFQEALEYCDIENGLYKVLSPPIEKLYSINFVVQAFYKAFEELVVEPA